MRVRTRVKLALLAVGLLAGFAWAGGFRRDRPADPIVLDEGALMIRNTSDREWRNVVVYVNDHYRGAVATLAPGGMLRPPLSQFVEGYGRRFDPARQRVFGVLLTAEDDRGGKVRYTHGTVNR